MTFRDVTDFDDVVVRGANAVAVMVDGEWVDVVFADGRYTARYMTDVATADTALGAILGIFHPHAPKMGPKPESP